MEGSLVALRNQDLLEYLIVELIVIVDFKHAFRISTRDFQELAPGFCLLGIFPDSDDEGFDVSRCYFVHGSGDTCRVTACAI